MAAPASSGFRFEGELDALRAAITEACRQSSLTVKCEKVEQDQLTLTALQETNFLATNWPVTLTVAAQRSGDGYAVTVRGESELFSFTQRANNKLRTEQLADTIRKQLGSGPARQ
jgi:hypothetical protein